jgi:hypothetical protein
MIENELKYKIEQLNRQLAEKELDYTNALKMHKGYHTLRSIREQIRKVRDKLSQIKGNDLQGTA